MMITKGLVTGFWKGRRRPAAGPAGVRGESDAARTSPILLDRVRDWGDHPAWAEFHQRYNPMLRQWCGRFAFDADTSDELCQRIWVELMARMRTFRYDPSRGFRNWLWMLFRSRAIDLLRQRRAAQQPAHEDFPSGVLSRRPPDRDPDQEDGEAEEPSTVLVRLAEETQAAVRARIDAETWCAYWIVAIEDRSIREAAEILGKSYTAIYTGYKRVDRMLRAEGERRLAELMLAESGR